jgi:CRISPR-associated endonuclease Csn1
MKYILGLDLGVASIGWAIIEIDDNQNPVRIIQLGVRCFESGTGTQTEIMQGKDESRNLARRTARLVRRNLWRRKRRTLKVFNILRNAGLLPMGKDFNDSPADRTELIHQLDKQLRDDLAKEGIYTDILPYTLRTLALEKPLPPFALGRVFLHLSQQRGFLSNKKTSTKDEDEGKVKTGISDLQKAITEKGSRTLGEYLASLDPHNLRIRQRWTGRQMFQDEFAAIWNVQATGQSPLLTRTLREKLFKALFYQRPLKSQKDLIGRCDLEPDYRRAPSASVEAQRFRYWQKILDLEVEEPNGVYRSLTREEQDKLAAELEHTEKLTFSAMRKLLGLTKPKGAWKFNLETEGVKDIRGNSTSARIGAILGDRWFKRKESDLPEADDYWGVLADESVAPLTNTEQVQLLSQFEKTALIDEILQFEHEDALARRLEKHFAFDSSTASQLAAVRLEDEHISLSKMALRRIVPTMLEKRVRFATARKEIYEIEKIAKVLVDLFGIDLDTGKQLTCIALNDHEKTVTNVSLLLVEEGIKKISVADVIKTVNDNKFDKTAICDFLPQVERDKKNLTKPFFKDAVRNPIVLRSLTEVRKVVNAIIRKYGKPEIIRVELARDMKKSRKERIDIDKKNRENEKKRVDAAKLILREFNNAEPKPIEIQKILLAEECNWQCPYTGKTITPRTLLGDSPQFDIEHTLPFSRSLDNSFINKSLCDVYENRHVKGGKTPFEAYGHDQQRWHEIMCRVSKFQGTFAELKRRRFEMREIPEGFVSRNLNDTRYISRLAGEYLGTLYGGKIDADGTLRVQVSSGGMTAYLRGEWKLNEILNDGNEKNRNDHRHHAVDAVVVACNNAGTVQKLASAAEQASDLGKHRLFIKGGVEMPFADFKQEVGNEVARINVSFRADRRVSGGLHNETNYSPIRETKEKIDKNKSWKKNWKTVESHHIRKPVTSLTTEKQINDIVDPVIRRIVLEKWQKLDKRKFTENDLPFMTTKDGRHIIIRKVRVRDNTSTITLAPETVKERHVAPGSNHHIEVFEVLDSRGNVKKTDWRCANLFDVMQRMRVKLPIIAKSDHYEDGNTPTRLKFSLAKGEFVEATLPGEDIVLLKVASISEGDMSLSLHTDGRIAKEQKETGDFQKYRVQSVKKLEQFKIRKVLVDVLGNVHSAND